MKLAFFIFLVFASSANCSPLAKKPSAGASSANSSQAQSQSQQQTQSQWNQETIRQADAVAHRWPIEFRQAGLSAALESNDSKIRQDGSTFQLKFWRSDLGTLEDGPYVPPTSVGYTVCVRPWMIMSGGVQHGSWSPDPIGIELNEETGTYTIKPIAFTMEGVWQLYVELCSGQVRCDGKGGYKGCPAGQLYEQAMASFEVHEGETD